MLSACIGTSPVGQISPKFYTKDCYENLWRKLKTWLKLGGGCIVLLPLLLNHHTGTVCSWNGTTRLVPLCLSACPHVSLHLPLDGFMWSSMFGILWTFVKLQVLLKSVKNVGHSTWWPEHILLMLVTLNHRKNVLFECWCQVVTMAVNVVSCYVTLHL